MADGEQLQTEEPRRVRSQDLHRALELTHRSRGIVDGKTVNPDAPIWRAGANATTRLTTQVPLEFGGKTIVAGEYNVFVELKEKAWTLDAISGALASRPRC